MNRSDKLSFVFLCFGVFTVFGSYTVSPTQTLIIVPIGFSFVFIGGIINARGGKTSPLIHFFPILTAFTVGSMFVIPQFGLYGQDSIGDFQIALKIAETLEYPVSLPPTPLSFLTPDVYATVLEISLLSAAKYLPLLFLSIGTLGFYVLVRSRSSQSMALLASLALVSVPWHMTFSSWFTKQMLGLPLVLFIIYILLIYGRRNVTRCRVAPLLTILVSAVVLTHHLSTAGMLLIAIGSVVSRIMIGFIPTRLRRLVFTDDWNVSSIVVAFIFVIAITYWAFKYRLPIVAGISPIVEVGQIGNSGQSQSIPKVYHSFYEWVRVTWNTSQYQVILIGGGISVTLGYRLIALRERITRTEFVLGVFSLAFVSALYLAVNTQLPTTHSRMLQWLWLGALPLLVLSCERSQLKKIGIGILGIFIVLNLLTFPYYELSMNADPAWDAHEKGYGRYEPDHTAAEWLGEVGTLPVTYSDRSGSVINLHAPALASKAQKQWMFLRSDIPSYYVYVAPIDREFLSAGAPPPTTHPPPYDRVNCLDKIYENPNRAVYLKTANRSCMGKGLQNDTI